MPAAARALTPRDTPFGFLEKFGKLKLILFCAIVSYNYMRLRQIKNQWRNMP